MCECACVCGDDRGGGGECEPEGGGEARTNAKNGRRHLLRSARFWLPVLLLLLLLLLGILLPAIQHTHTNTLTQSRTATQTHARESQPSCLCEVEPVACSPPAVLPHSSFALPVLPAWLPTACSANNNRRAEASELASEKHKP